MEWQTAALRRAGVRDIAIVRGWAGEKLDGFAEHYFENRRWAETNMVMSLAKAASWLRAEPCLVSYSDSFYIAATVERLMGAPEALAITYDPDWLVLWSQRSANPLSDAETFRLDAHSLVAEIGNKPTSVEEVEGQYMGFLEFTPDGWEAVETLLGSLEPSARDRLDMTSMLRLLIERSAGIVAVPVEGPWGEVDTGGDLALYNAMFERGTIHFPR